jgi:23S rRNA pseudouridine1911/1915/1917 synthase
MIPVILYEDNHLLAVDKPHGLLTQPSGTDQPSLEAYCKDFLKKRDEKPGNVYLHAVHRLDKPAAGIVLFAKSSKALSRLNASIRNKSVEKHYEALVEGRLPETSGQLKHFLLHENHKAQVVSQETPGAKLASLRYEMVEEFGETSKISIQLETGRYHQIRAQFAEIDYPIVGDTKYGSLHDFPSSGIALIHKMMIIEHPVTKDKIVIESKIDLTTH